MVLTTLSRNGRADDTASGPKIMKESAIADTGGLVDSPEDRPLVNVITVVRNGGKYLEHAIKSVLAQTYHHLEYIVIDGGSRDSSVDIIKRYSSYLAYWHSKPDKGVSHAYNLGLDQAKGDWILFLSADDYFLDYKVVEEMVPYLSRNRKIEVVFGETIIMTRGQEPGPAPLTKIWGDRWEWRKVRWSSQIPHPSAFTNRRYFDKYGRFDETFRYAVDYELYLRAGKALRTLFVPIPVSGMRQGGLSGQNLVRSYGEVRRAQLKHRFQPNWLCWLTFFWQILRCNLGRGAHLALDPFASQIVWRGRYSGKHQ
jgi:glycosyltransferase involved in cell wall biosynthesis